MNLKFNNNAWMQFTILILIAFINFLLVNYNMNWLFGVQVSPLMATVISFVFLRSTIPVAIIGYTLQDAGMLLPLFSTQ